MGQAACRGPQCLGCWPGLRSQVCSCFCVRKQPSPHTASSRTAAGYAFLASPNQTPSLDMYYLKKLSGLAGNDGFTMNPIFEQLFFIMGIWPAVYAALLIPSGRSGNRVRVRDTSAVSRLSGHDSHPCRCLPGPLCPSPLVWGTSPLGPTLQVCRVRSLLLKPVPER